MKFSIANCRLSGYNGNENQLSFFAISDLKLTIHRIRRGVGVADRAGFENRCAPWGTAGSNPALSAYLKRSTERVETFQPRRRKPPCLQGFVCVGSVSDRKTVHRIGLNAS